ncbi:uncharacterized protein LOC133295257 [Gastrolobium bilobum]|uniref:uncharacterized protein LOC133295257 n=1 Tax=Gastrolobium bilobum TaxID=150636 RepID=UPI002AB323B4|nr:uncharacterized protein LOC133295257 [Gastrolobium bilobum]
MRGKLLEFPLDLEITKTEKRNRKLARKKLSFNELGILSEEAHIMAGNNEADNPLMDTILAPSFNSPNSSIIHPEVGNNNWELKSVNIQLVERAQFGREDDEDPHRFIDRFLMICDSTKHLQVSNDAIRLRMFPFALKGKALNWLERQPARSIPSWENLSNKFFFEFFSMERYNQMVNDITNFTQAEGETMCAAWNRFKDLMRRCPHYPMTNGDQVRIFFNGCKPEIRMVLNGAAGGRLTAKPKRGILHLDNNDAVLAENKLLSQQMANLTSRLDKMQLSSVQAQAASVVCEYCKDNHESNECPSLLSVDPPQQVHVNGVWYDQRPPPQNVPKNQNFPSGNNNFQMRVQGTGLDFKSNNYLQPPPVQPKEPSNLEKLVGQMAQHSNSFMEETRANTRNTQASIRNLENQIGQIAKQMAERAPGTFPNNTVTNSKEDCMDITTRSGKVVAAPTKSNTNVEADEKFKEPEKEVVILSEVEKPVQKSEEEEPPIIVEKKKFKLNPEYVRAMAPYPERFKKYAQKQQYVRFLDIFKKLHVNIPFAEALANMPNYAKFMKDLALCDLGEIINLISLSVCKYLGITELKPTMVSLQLADRSLRRPSGIIEHVLVKVDKFIFPSDFVVLDLEEGTEMPLLLGRPFLATA